MTTTLHPYPDHKPSGIKWLDEVPAHWDVRRLKGICRLTYGDSLPSEARNDRYVPSSIKVGYEISFTRHFYKPQPLRALGGDTGGHHGPRAGDGGAAERDRGRFRPMKLDEWFGKFHLDKIKINLAVLNLEITLEEADKDAAWELYVEMLTRIVTQPLPCDMGNDQAALDSVYALFPITRTILRERGRSTVKFSMLAIPVLNQVVRPFTTKWHRESLAGAFNDEAKCGEFRRELAALQNELRNYNRLLAGVAGVEDLTDLERTTGK